MTATISPLAVRRPVVARTRAQLDAALDSVRQNGGRVGLVPTMGALHAGHESLIRICREVLGTADAVVVSIFVNPLQFGPNEDLADYPRTLDADLEMCATGGVDVVFAPAVAEVYPGGEPEVTIEPGPLAGILEGGSRPTHFRGVLTLVAKLFGLVRPDLAVFGQKDYQQLVLVRQMVADLSMGVDIIGAETVRDPDGLALSSRNKHLDDEQRHLAISLSRALRAGVEAGGQGAEAALSAARRELRKTEETGGITMDYLELVSPGLGDAPEEGEARLLVAARVGATRLIDNTVLVLGA